MVYVDYSDNVRTFMCAFTILYENFFILKININKK